MNVNDNRIACQTFSKQVELAVVTDRGSWDKTFFSLEVVQAAAVGAIVGGASGAYVGGAAAGGAAAGGAGALMVAAAPYALAGAVVCATGWYIFQVRPYREEVCRAIKASVDQVNQAIGRYFDLLKVPNQQYDRIVDGGRDLIQAFRQNDFFRSISQDRVVANEDRFNTVQKLYHSGYEVASALKISMYVSLAMAPRHLACSRDVRVKLTQLVRLNVIANTESLKIKVIRDHAFLTLAKIASDDRDLNGARALKGQIVTDAVKAKYDQIKDEASEDWSNF